MGTLGTRRALRGPGTGRKGAVRARLTQRGSGRASEVARGAGLALGGAFVPHESPGRAEQAVAWRPGTFIRLKSGFWALDAVILARLVLKCTGRAQKARRRSLLRTMSPGRAFHANALRVCADDRREHSFLAEEARRHPHVPVVRPSFARLALGFPGGVTELSGGAEKAVGEVQEPPSRALAAVRAKLGRTTGTWGCRRASSARKGCSLR